MLMRPISIPWDQKEFSLSTNSVDKYVNRVGVFVVNEVA